MSSTDISATLILVARRGASTSRWVVSDRLGSKNSDRLTQIATRTMNV
jgi:hypothetical protein